jgi:predicted RNA polymerase sigma factor
VDTLTYGGGSREAGPGQDQPGPAARSADAAARSDGAAARSADAAACSDGAAARSADAAARSAGVAARDSYGRLLALLAAATSDLPAAEDALADAFERALRTWPSHGVPASPDAWLLTVARNRLRDQWKSARVQRAVPLDAGQDVLVHIDDVDVDAIPDRRLELMLVCAHPAIERAVRTPLMLNTVLGFTAEQIGRAFSVPPSTMATRLVRAKKRIKAAGIPFRIPDLANLPARMTSVLEAVYGAYVIDWSTGPQARRLPPEALHLAEVLATLVPGDPEVRGLAALIELSVARAPARVDASGRFVPLADQDPSLWNAQLICRAHEHLRAAHARGQLGRFQLEAAIQAVHCARNHGARNHGARNHGARELGGTTDWATLLTLHRVLHAVAPSLGSGVALAAVTAEVDGPAAGLATLDALLAEAGQQAGRFQPAKATRAHLLDRLGRTQEAVAAYESAISLTHDAAERQYLEHRRDRAIRRDVGLGRSGQFLKQEHERLVREAGRLAQAHLAGAVGRQVRLRRRLVEPGFLVTGGRDDEFGVQQPAVTGGAAAGRADRHENLAGQPAGQPLEGLGQPQVGGGAGRVDRGALDALGDGERRE